LLTPPEARALYTDKQAGRQEYLRVKISHTHTHTHTKVLTRRTDGHGGHKSIYMGEKENRTALTHFGLKRKETDTYAIACGPV